MFFFDVLALLPNYHKGYDCLLKTHVPYTNIASAKRLWFFLSKALQQDMRNIKNLDCRLSLII